MNFETIYTNGNNIFENNKMSWKNWSAPIMKKPQEIKEYIQKFNLVGRKIKRLKMVGLSYFLTRDWIEEAAYNSYTDDMDEDERQRLSEYNNISGDLQFSRCSILDEPLLIEFEDGERFEIEFPQEAEVKCSMNCIPWNIEAGVNLPNVDANVLFSPCLEKIIEKVEVKTYITDKEPLTSNLFDDKGTKYELLSEIVLWLEGGIGIACSGWIDYFSVICINSNNEVLPISFKELKPTLFNFEDIQKEEQ